MSDTMHISRRVQLDILIREKERELAWLREEREKYAHRESDWRCVAQIKSDIIHLESYRKSGGDLQRFALRLLMDESARRSYLTDGVREVTEFRIDSNRERAYMPSWVPLWDCPITTKLFIEWADGTGFVSYVMPFDDEWTEAAKEAAK
jgi:hypothetical protein